jgi:hypothetical protein
MDEIRVAGHLSVSRTAQFEGSSLRHEPGGEMGLSGRLERRKRMGEEKTFTEEIQTTGAELVAKVKELVHEGNVRRIIVKNEESKTLIEIPLTLGVVGALLVPVAAGLGAIAALVTDCTIVVEKVKDA